MLLIALALIFDFAAPESYPFLPAQRLGPGLAVLMGVLSLACPTVGALIASRLPANPIGWIFCGVGLLYAEYRFAQAYTDGALLEGLALPGGEYVVWFSAWGDAGWILAGVFLMLLFPDGRLPSRRWRIVAWAAVLGTALAALARALMPGSMRSDYFVANPFGLVGAIGGVTTFDFFAALNLVGMALLLVGILAAVVSLIRRLRRAREDERQQLKWFMLAAVPAAIGLVTIHLHMMVITFTGNFTAYPTLVLFPVNSQSFKVINMVGGVTTLALLLVPVCTYVAILRYRLYDIDVVINRALVYGALTACVVGIYVLAVGALGVLFQAQSNLGISLLATGAVALLFQPLRTRLQRGVNRLMYGERDDPRAVVSRLGRRLEATIVPEAVLPTVVETIAQALKLPYAALLLKEAGGYRTAADYGSPVGETESLPLVYRGEEIGRLVIAPRAPREGFSDADRRLLEDLARHAEVAVHAVRLTADLQRSRERLVAAREEERRRLRRDLHDGVGPTLTGLALQLNVARRLVASDRTEDAEETLARLEARTQETIAEMRRLIYGLRPPALDDLGLVHSVRQQAVGQGMLDGPEHVGAAERLENGTVFSVEAPEEFPELPAAVEVACYRIAQEAITNVSRHARAGTCRVRFSVDRAAGALALEISDDGEGMPEERVAGVGLSSMRERAEELGGTLTVAPGRGGGTRVLARLPLHAPENDSAGEASWVGSSTS